MSATWLGMTMLSEATAPQPLIGHMASIKNSTRSKRKYTEARRLRTEANAAKKQIRHDLRQAKMVERTQALIGRSVAIRLKDRMKPLVGIVTDVIRKGDEDYPIEARRHHGAYLKVQTSFGDHKISRHRVKPLPSE
jgi:hypothetical protein